MDRLLGVSWLVAGGVVIATVAIYLTLVVLVRVVGQRSLASMTTLDVGCVAAFGAVIGRTMLLRTPTLLSGVIVLVTLFGMQVLLRVVGRSPRIDRWFQRSPVVLMDDGAMLIDNMRRAHVSADDLRQFLRLAGITRLSDVRYVVLERNGGLSVLRNDGELDAGLVADLPALAARTR